MDPESGATGHRTEASTGGLDLVYESVLARAPTAALILDTSLRVTTTNVAFDAIAVVKPGDTLKTALPYLHDELQPLVVAALESGATSNRAILRSAPGADDRRGYWEVSVFPVDRLAGERLGVGLLLSDVTERRRADRRSGDSVVRLDIALAAGDLATWDWDLVGNEITWGRSAAELGLPHDATDLRPESSLAIVHPEDREDHRRMILAAAQAGEDFRNEVRIAREDGETQWIEVRGRVVKADDGTPRRMIGMVADITERRLIEAIKTQLLDREHEARVEAETARDRLSLLSEVGAALLDTLDSTTVLESLPGLLVPRICDWCTVDLLTSDGSLEEVRTEHVDPEMQGVIRSLRRWRLSAGGYGLWSIRRTMATHSSELAVEIDDSDLVKIAVNDEHLGLLRSLAPRSTITVPLMGRTGVLGGITVGTTHDRRLDPDDRTLMESLAGRLAMALENARLFESRTQVARALQQTLLPPILPRIPGVELVARYRVAADGIDIGGDFYDAFERGLGTWAVVLGDVCGKGAGAAAVTGLFRHTLRAVAMSSASPAEVLRSTNEAILGQIEDTRYCTAVYLTVTPASSEFTNPGKGSSAADVAVAVACGGHPRPLVVRANGEVNQVSVAGTLLGVLPDLAVTDVDLVLRPGDAMVLYTDGVSEARRGSEWFGEDGIVNALSSAVDSGVSGADDLADRLLASVDAYQDGPADDIAILVLRVKQS